jgi:transmembrane sensor
MKKTDSRQDLLKMIRDYLSGSSNQAQRTFLESYFLHFEGKEDVVEKMDENSRQQLGAEMLAEIEDTLFAPQRQKRSLWTTFARVAAMILVVLSIGIYFYKSTTSIRETTPEQSSVSIVPGGNKATLTLSGGRRISLDDANIGKLASQGGVNILKTYDGQLVYDLSGNERGSAVAMNTIETPRGGQYQVILPDGTKVWLNAESKLVFPSVFKGSERKVELSGEAYFEVARFTRLPFLVSSAGQVVEVLGTHFNISSYGDEPQVKTTLLEGSVRVSDKKSGQSFMLSPGQQTSLSRVGIMKLSQVNAEDAIAWKEGNFLFDNQSIEEVMRKISRWYDVDIEYRGKQTKETFVGQAPKFDKISDVLAVLELTGLAHFKIEGRRVIVMP